MPRTPQAAAILAANRPGEAEAAVRRGNIRRALDLLLHALGAAVELQEQGRPLRQFQIRVCIARAYLEFVEEFHARHLDAALADLGDGVHRTTQRCEGAGRGADLLRLRVQAQGEFRDDAEGAFGPDKCMHEVIAGRRLPRPGPTANQPAVGERDLECHDVLCHRAVADCRRA